MQRTEYNLTDDMMARASFRGNEYAWLISDLPAVIDQVRHAGLVSIGGQLQFRIPDGGTCECSWVQISSYPSAFFSLPWSQRVSRSAEIALSEFQKLQVDFDFAAEGRNSWRELANFEAQGGDLHSITCFVWYVEAEA